MVEMLWNVSVVNAGSQNSGSLRVQQGEQKKGKGLLLGRNSPFNKIPIIGAIL